MVFISFKRVVSSLPPVTPYIYPHVLIIIHHTKPPSLWAIATFYPCLFLTSLTSVCLWKLFGWVNLSRPCTMTFLSSRSSACFLQTGRVLLRTHLWQCSSESLWSFQWESVACFQQRAWLTRTGSSSPTNGNTKRRRGIIHRRQHKTTCITQTDRNNISHSPLCSLNRRILNQTQRLICREARANALI